MTADIALIVAAITAAFVIFAGVLAWAEYQTRNLQRPESASEPETGSSSSRSAHDVPAKAA